MTGRVCYIARGGGDRILAVRIAGLRGEESWASPAGAADSMAVLAETNQAAAWIASHAGRHGVGMLVVDVGGGQCRWVTTPGAEPAVVAAAMAQSEEWDGGRSFSSSWGAPTIAEACVQTLGPPVAAPPGGNGQALALRNAETGQGARMGALAIPDVSARLLVDALDQRGVGVERSVSLWHALAIAWDPAAARGAASGDVVATSAPITAAVLIDESRVVWSWSRSGDLLAGGTMRLPRQSAGAQIAPDDVARLAADWLSWSVQLGVAPARVIVLTPRLEAGNESLSAQDLGMRLGKVWPGAIVDLAVHEDPLGATLGRLAAIVDETSPDEDRGQALVTLARRPGRAHRAMYRWSAVAMLVCAIALGAIGWKAWNGAAAARDRASEVRTQTMQEVESVTPSRDDVERAKMENSPRAFLEAQIAAKRQLLNPSTGLDPAKPILAELDALSYVLGNPEFRITNLDLSSSGVLVTVEVPDTASGEELIRSMQGVHGSNVAEWNPVWGDASGSTKRSVLLQGRWAPDAGARAGGPS